MIALLRELAETFGPSGREEDIRRVIHGRINNKADEIYTDALGNLIAIKKGKGKRIMLAAHMDEIGLVATFVDDKGFIRFSGIGGVNPFFSLGQRVRFRNGTVGCVCHEETLEEFKDLKFNRMYIDIGAKNREDAQKSITPGDMAVFTGETAEQNGRYISKALDNRIGCAILITLLEQLEEINNEVFFVFTVQEEVGLRGAGPATYAIKPDIALAVDVTGTGDTPECKPMSVELGKGPAVMIKDNRTISHPSVKNALIDCAKRLNIPFQFEVLNVGGNDAGTIHTAAGGIPTGGVSIPCRYLHSQGEIADVTDIENTIKLIKAFISTAI